MQVRQISHLKYLMFLVSEKLLSSKSKVDKEEIKLFLKLDFESLTGDKRLT